MGEEIMKDEGRDYTKRKDLPPFISIAKGNFDSLKDLKTPEAVHAHLEAIRQDFTQHVNDIQMPGEIPHRGAVMFLESASVEAYLTGLAAILRDLGYPKEEVTTHFLELRENDQRGQLNHMAPNAIDDLVELTFKGETNV